MATASSGSCCPSLPPGGIRSSRWYILNRRDWRTEPPALSCCVDQAWRSKPSFYAVSTEDRTIHPDLERFMAKRMGANTIEVKASHLSLISHPDVITDLILEAARETPR